MKNQSQILLIGVLLFNLAIPFPVAKASTVGGDYIGQAYEKAEARFKKMTLEQKEEMVAQLKSDTERLQEQLYNAEKIHSKLGTLYVVSGIAGFGGLIWLAVDINQTFIDANEAVKEEIKALALEPEAKDALAEQAEQKLVEVKKAKATAEEALKKAEEPIAKAREAYAASDKGDEAKAALAKVTGSKDAAAKAVNEAKIQVTAAEKALEKANKLLEFKSPEVAFAEAKRIRNNALKKFKNMRPIPKILLAAAAVGTFIYMNSVGDTLTITEAQKTELDALLTQLSTKLEKFEKNLSKVKELAKEIEENDTVEDEEEVEEKPKKIEKKSEKKLKDLSLTPAYEGDQAVSLLADLTAYDDFQMQEKVMAELPSLKVEEVYAMAEQIFKPETYMDVIASKRHPEAESLICEAKILGKAQKVRRLLK